MSINYCTVSQSTLNSFCSPRRGLIIAKLAAILRKPKVTTKRGGNVQQAKYQNYTHPPVWEPPVISTERDRIVVSATFMDKSGHAEQLNTQRLDIVFITNLKLSDAQISVNIQNFKVH